MADRYHLPMLFAYKTFSYTSEHEKFRVVFYTDKPIKDANTSMIITRVLMKLFNDTPDKACKDVARMFFGGKGLLYRNDNYTPIDIRNLISIELEQYFQNKHDEKHYKRDLRKFFATMGVDYDTIKILDNTDIISIQFEDIQTAKSSKAVTKEKKSRRKLTRNFDWNALKDCCKLYQNFINGTKYYFYNELLFLATNLCNIEGGRKHFLDVLNAPQNSYCEAYFNRDWKSICNSIINYDYQPTSCDKCIYADICQHRKNMISTAKIPNSIIKVTKELELCSIEDAENSLKKEFYHAITSFGDDIHIIKAQTGLGKTNLYLNFLKDSKVPYIIAVPTNDLKDEIYSKAISMGIKNIIKTPTQPKGLSVELNRKIAHMYSIGAGYMVLRYLKSYFLTLDKSNVEYTILKDYFDNLDAIEKHQGHIITTHMNMLLMKDELIQKYQIIVDEDILKTAFSINQVTFEDIKSVRVVAIF